MTKDELKTLLENTELNELQVEEINLVIKGHISDRAVLNKATDIIKELLVSLKDSLKPNTITLLYKY